MVRFRLSYLLAAMVGPLPLGACREKQASSSATGPERAEGRARDVAVPRPVESKGNTEAPPASPQEWRNHPALAGRFHPEYPDDLQVIVHEGGPRLTKAAPELIWVRINGVRNGVFKGKLLNAPHQLVKLKQGDEIGFLVKKAWEHPVQVRENYLKERGGWVIEGCDKCGFDELFDAPSELLPVIFPGMPEGAVPEAFTSFCPLCGGVQLVRDKDAPVEE